MSGQHPAARQRAAVFVHCALYASLGLASATLPSVLPQLSAQVAQPMAALGVLFALRSGGGLLGCWLGGWLIGRFAARDKVLLLTLLGLVALGTAAIALLHNLWWLGALLGLRGVAESALVVCSSQALSWTYGERAAPMLSAAHFAFGLGCLSAPLIIAAMMQSGAGLPGSGLLGCLALLALLMLVAAPWVGFLPPLQAAHWQSDSEPVAPLGWRALAVIVLFFLLYTGAESAFGGWVAAYANLQWGTAATQAGLLVSVFWAAMAAGRLGAALFAARFAAARLLPLLLLGGIAGIVLALLSPSFVWLGIATALTGLFMAPIFPLAFAMLVQRTRGSSRMAGIFFASATGGAMLLPWLAASTLGVTLWPASLLLVALLAQTLAWRLFGQLREGK